MPIYAMGKRTLESQISDPQPYTGITDVYNRAHALEMVDELKKHRGHPGRKLMVGVMASPLSLDPSRGRGVLECDRVREVYPLREQLASAFTDHPDVLNTIHLADLYGPHQGKYLDRDLELCVEHGGPNLHAIQLDLTWPDPSKLVKFKKENPNIPLILQVGKFALKQTKTPQEVVEKLKGYGNLIDYALFDASMGMGKGMQAEHLLPFLREVRRELPYLNLAVAGGFGPETVEQLKYITDEFPNISIDAQGMLKRPDSPKDTLGHFIATHPADVGRSKDYLRKSCEILDKLHKERLH